jgi:hypothetical protein
MIMNRSTPIQPILGRVLEPTASDIYQYSLNLIDQIELYNVLSVFAQDGQKATVFLEAFAARKI